MSRETLLDDAIAKAKEAEDWQLVEWLRMARGGESAARWYSDKLREAHRTERKLLDENGRLREQLADMPRCEACEAMDDCWECLRADASHKERRRLDYQNEQLRELVRDMADYGEGAGNGMAEWFADRMRELGVEVG